MEKKLFFTKLAAQTSFPIKKLFYSSLFYKDIVFLWLPGIYDYISLLFRYNNYFISAHSFLANTLKLQLRNKKTFNIKHFSFKQSVLNIFSVGLKYLWLGIRFWIIPLYVFFICFFYMFLNKSAPLNKVLFIIFTLTSFFYWLLSGFTFFIKKYQYRYFTSAIQRFWKRSLALFWMLEFFLFFCFFYLTLMSSQEPFFMFDNSQIFKTHLFSWRSFLLKVFPMVMVILLTYFLIISLKWNSFSKISFLLNIITFILFYILWSEFYQFYSIVSYYGNLVWKFNEDSCCWFLENEFKRTRIQNHFLTICLIAKFWHVVFAAYFWLFFVIRGLELNRLRFPLLSSNLQNFILVYILSWLYMFPWLKRTFLLLFNTPYYWFYINNKRVFFYKFSGELNSFVNASFLNIFVEQVCKVKLLFEILYDFTFNVDFFLYKNYCEETASTQFKKKISLRITFSKTYNKYW